MDVTIVANDSPHQSSHALAMAEGLRRHGLDVQIQRHSRVKSRTAICWGWRAGRELRARGKEVLVMERGYLGDRFRWTSLGWNGLNGRASFAIRNDPSRFNARFALRPWKSGGDYVLLMGQVPGDAALAGRDLTDWYAKQAAKCVTAYNLPIRFRPHPIALERGQARTPRGATRLTGTLEDALAEAAIVVTFNSNAGVDAVVNGVPVLVGDEGSMALEMASRRGFFDTPDREEWAARLAWKQFSMDEIRNGEAWDIVSEHHHANAATV